MDASRLAIVMKPCDLIFCSVPSWANAGAASTRQASAAMALVLRNMAVPPRWENCTRRCGVFRGAGLCRCLGGPARRIRRLGYPRAVWRTITVSPPERTSPMHFPSHEQKQAILAQLLRIADQRLAGERAAEARAFIAQYYDQVDAEDLAARTPEDLYGAAMAHLAFAREFSSGMPKLRVYNPRAEEHGWASPHTVIEIVNDDMPFLVDSVTMELNRQGYTLHLLNHPILAVKRDAEGALQSFGPSSKDVKSESLIHAEVDRE